VVKIIINALEAFVVFDEKMNVERARGASAGARGTTIYETHSRTVFDASGNVNR
jgi:hypothetical protein